MKHNFGAGPCILPAEVFQQASEAVLNFNGLSILEISHRSKDYVAVMEEARELVKQALNVPKGYTVLYLQGGATLGFTISALNSMRVHKRAAYINTGTWATGAINEAKKVGIDAVVVGSSEDKDFTYIPKDYELSGDFDYFYYCANNTIRGTEFHATPKTNLPLVCDMSSDIMSKEINVADFDLIYAGAQKNIGPAGTTIYIVKEEFLGKSTSSFMPKYLDLNQHYLKDSMMNTPPVYSIYVAMLNLRHMMANGGVKAMEAANKAKSDLLYGEVDTNPLFVGNVAVEDRSKMNVTFHLKEDSLNSLFNSMCDEAGIVGYKGHRSVGGYRASLYNALPLSSVQVLVDVMKEFTRKNG